MKIDPDNTSPSPTATAPSERTLSNPEASPTTNLRLLEVPFDLEKMSVFGLFLIAFFWVLSEARALFLPVVISGLLTFLLDPIVRWIHGFRIPRSLAAATVLVTFLAIFSFGIHRSIEPAQEWIGDLPRSMKQVERKLNRLMEPVEEVSEAAREVERLAKMPGGDEAPTVEVSSTPSLGESLYDGTLTLLLTTGVVLILTYFLLASGDLFLQKLVRMLPRLHDRRKVVGISRQIQREVSTHLFTITLINFSLGGCVALATYWIGLPDPLIWGAMAALLNFIPYLGAMGGMVILFGASLLHFEEPLHALLPSAVYLLLTSLEGSLVTPMILGRRLSLNPVVIFLGLFFWGWIWGVAGAFLAVPLLIATKIVCDHVSPLQPIGEFLGR